MTQFTRLLSSVAFLPIALPAAAEVTPDEVWAMFEDVTAATGAVVTSDTTQDGDTLTVSESSTTWTFPFDAGELTVRYGPVTLSALNDGSVEMVMGEPLTVAIAGRIAIEGDEASVTATMSLSQPGAQTIITGTADDMTMTSSSPSIEVTFDDVDLTIPDDDFDLSALTLTATSGPTTSTTRYVREADVFRLSSESSTVDNAFALRLPIEDEALVENLGTSGATTNSSTIVLPRSEMSILNLSAAIRDGLAISGEISVTDQSSTNTTTIGTAVSSSQTTSTAQQDSSFSFGPDGMSIDASASGSAISFLMPDMLPFPIEAEVAGAEAQFVLPLLASADAAVPVEYDVSVNGLTLSDQIWGLFDPAEFIPRDPVDVVIDLGAEVRPLVDALDIMTLISTIDGGETPVELDAVRIDQLTVRAAGAELDGSGAFTLDFSDMVTIPDFPRPEGSATATLNGANALMDTLLTMGLLSEEDLMGARMGLGMFTTPVGEDMLESEVIIDDTGGISVNGMRIR